MTIASDPTIEPTVAASAELQGRIVPFDQQSWIPSVPTPCEKPAFLRGELSWDELYVRLYRDPDDHVAFAALIRRVARWAERQLRTPNVLRELSEDVIAETCAAVILNLHRAYGAETFAGFVFGQFLTARRRYLRFLRLECVPVDDVQVAQIDERGPNSDELALLDRCLLELQPRERRAVELRYYGEASSREIAEALGVTETNARRIVFNGLAHLRKSAHRQWPCGRDG
jgi:RNA polymerase sigma factor (sigma-70 family)